MPAQLAPRSRALIRWADYLGAMQMGRHLAFTAPLDPEAHVRLGRKCSAPLLKCERCEVDVRVASSGRAEAYGLAHVLQQAEGRCFIHSSGKNVSLSPSFDVERIRDARHLLSVQMTRGETGSELRLDRVAGKQRPHFVVRYAILDDQTVNILFLECSAVGCDSGR